MQPELLTLCQAAPDGARCHVYIFFIRGIEPVDCTNLEGVREYVHSLGFYNTYYGTWLKTASFTAQVREIHKGDPNAHFVLIGFSAGANMVRNMAQAVKRDGICIDLLVYLGGNTLYNVPHDQPENATHIVNVLARGFIWNGAQMDHAENVQLDGVWHFGSPSHPKTLEILTRQLAEVAGKVPPSVITGSQTLPLPQEDGAPPRTSRP